MLQFIRNSENIIRVTFTETMVDSTNYILLKFVNEMNNLVTVSTLLNITNSSVSANPRYDEFVITDTDDPDATAAEIKFTRNGTYYYQAFAIENFDLDQPGIIKLLETGRCLVSGGDEQLADVYK